MEIEHTISSSTYFEWYDGFVSGLITTDSATFLCWLIEFRDAGHQRLYAWYQIDESQRAEIEARFSQIDPDDDSNRLLLEIAGLEFSRSQPPVYFSASTPFEGRVVHLSLLDDESSRLVAADQYPVFQHLFGEPRFSWRLPHTG
jgi:hypothetical protein